MAVFTVLTAVTMSSEVRAWGPSSGGELSFCLSSSLPVSTLQKLGRFSGICAPWAGGGAGILDRKPSREAGVLWEWSGLSFGGESSQSPEAALILLAQADLETCSLQIMSCPLLARPFL